MHLIGVGWMIDQEVPRIQKNQRATKKSALLEDLVAFLFLGAIELPLPGETKKGNQQQRTGIPARIDEEQRDEPERDPGNKPL